MADKTSKDEHDRPIGHLAQRGHGFVVSVERVRTAPRAIKNPRQKVIELADDIEAFIAERRLALQR